MARAVAKKKKAAVAVQDQMPGFMAGRAGEGTESLGQADVEIPRIKLIQKASAELDEFDDLRPGMFFHTVAEIPLIPEPNKDDEGQPWKSLEIIPLYTDMRYLLWRPQEDGGGILARADDGIHWDLPNASFDVKLKNGREVTWKTAPTVRESGLDKWGSEDPRDQESGPAATQTLNVVCYFPQFPQYSPAVLTFQRTGLKVGRKFIGKLKISEAPSYGMRFNISSKSESGPSGDYLVLTTKGAGFVADEELFNQCQSLYEIFRDEGLRIRDVEGMEETVETETADEGETAETEY